MRFTANVEANLAAIAKYWRDREAPDVFLTVLDELDTAVGHLERHPRIGRRFFARTAQSVEARQRVAELSRRFGDADVREYLSGDYLLLYTIRAAGPGSRTGGEIVHLLSIRHHRELSFDFEGFWRRNRPVAD